MNSCLYECHVIHARFTPRAHRFLYRIFLFAIDLDELPALDRTLPFFSLNRANLYAFREGDFLPTGERVHNGSAASVGEGGISKPTMDLSQTVGLVPAGRPSRSERDSRDGRPTSGSATKYPAPSTKGVGASGAPLTLKQRVVGYLAERRVDLAGGKVVLVTLPRVAGYLFNPVSFYFCFDRDGTPVAAIAEVTNTFKEMKPYFLGPATRVAGGGEFRLRLPKRFYVSPFSDVDVAFDFTLRAPGDKLAVQIDDYAGETRTLTSTLTGVRRELTGATLAWCTLKYPLITLKVITLIHWHAWRLWLKRVPWFAKAARAADQGDLYRPHPSIAPLQPSDVA